MNKKIKIVMIILIVVLSLFGAVLTGYMIGVREENSCQNNEKDNTNNIMSNVETDVFSILYKYGKDIYNKELYLNLEKDYNDIYYASLNDLDKLGYDINNIDKKCNRDTPVIYFDIEFKMDDNYEFEPLQFVINCNGNN